MRENQGKKKVHVRPVLHYLCVCYKNEHSGCISNSISAGLCTELGKKKREQGRRKGKGRKQRKSRKGRCWGKAVRKDGKETKAGKEQVRRKKAGVYSLPVRATAICLHPIDSAPAGSVTGLQR